MKQSLLEPQAKDSFAVHLIIDDGGDDFATNASESGNEEIRQTATILYQDFKARGLSVLLDDRKISLQEKLIEAASRAIPIIVIMDAAAMAAGSINAVVSKTRATRKIAIEDAPEVLSELAKQNL